MSGLPWSFHFASPGDRVQMLYRMIPLTEWDDDVEFQPLMLVDAETYKPKQLFDVVPAVPRTATPKTFVEYRNGDGKTWRYRNMRLPLGEGLSTVTEDRTDQYDEGSTHGRVYFDDTVVLPALTEVIHGSEQTWMSITPMEIFTCRSGVRLADQKAKRKRDPIKKVVIAGLGLGWMLQKVAELKSVKEIVVIEQSSGILDWYGREMCRGIKKVKKIVQADYWAVANDYPDHFHLIDIWPRLGEAFGDEHLDDLEVEWWAWGYQFGEDADMGAVMNEDDAIEMMFAGATPDEDESE